MQFETFSLPLEKYCLIIGRTLQFLLKQCSEVECQDILTKQFIAIKVIKIDTFSLILMICL